MEIKLEELAGGAFQENVQKAVEKVVANLLDPNTPWKNKRAVTAKITFTQNEDRDDCSCDISVETKLAAVKPMETKFAIGKDLKSGEVYAQEYGRQIRGQLTLDDIQPKSIIVDGKTVNSETGEITEEPKNTESVVDFRAAKKA